MECGRQGTALFGRGVVDGSAEDAGKSSVSITHRPRDAQQLPVTHLRYAFAGSPNPGEPPVQFPFTGPVAVAELCEGIPGAQGAELFACAEGLEGEEGGAGIGSMHFVTWPLEYARTIGIATEEERQRRRELYPELFRGKIQHYSGYSGFDWRNISEAKHRNAMTFVCQPAYALHSFWGCHYRCAYCGLGNVANINVNFEDFCDHIRESFHHLDKQPGQKLFQWDNGTDVVCWEPEYGGTKMLIELFAQEDDKYLKLYVGKSGYVDFMLDSDHRGHTFCCWSLSTQKQVDLMEARTAGMEERLAAARKCEEAGYRSTLRWRSAGSGK